MAMLIFWVVVLAAILGPGALVLLGFAWFAMCLGDAASGHDKHER